MPEHKTRFIPKPPSRQAPVEVPYAYNGVPYHGTG